MDGLNLRYGLPDIMSERDTTPLIIDGRTLSREEIPPIVPLNNENGPVQRITTPLMSPIREMLPPSPMEQPRTMDIPDRNILSRPPSVQYRSNNPVYERTSTPIERSPQVNRPPSIRATLDQLRPPSVKNTQPSPGLDPFNPLEDRRNKNESERTDEDYLDNYSYIDYKSEAEQYGIKQYYIVKLLNLSQTYPQLNIVIPTFSDRSSVIVHRYDVWMRYIKNKSSLTSNKGMLMVYFGALEILAVKVFGIKYAEGFCRMQLLMMDTYNSLLIEMGDSASDLLGDTSPFIKIIFFSLLYFVGFMVLSCIFHHISPTEGRNMMLNMVQSLNSNNLEGGASFIEKVTSFISSTNLSSLEPILKMFMGKGPEPSPAGARNPTYNE